MYVTNRYMSYRSEFIENLLAAMLGTAMMIAPVALHMFGIIGG